MQSSMMMTFRRSQHAWPGSVLLGVTRQVKRSEGEDWEKAGLNLPIVEGDEITTGGDSRVEIQFDNYQYLRLDENSYLKMAVLRDEGIALSLSLGTLNLRVNRFDKDRSYFEIDAPKTTIAVQKTGQYRIDAGQAGDAQIRVAVTQGGEARVYSETAGFSLKSGRSARVYITGDNAGEWEAEDSARYADEFDTWSQDRDELIAKRLGSAYYDKYYDQDIYGADDLNGYGEWVYISQYGYVWRPYPGSLSSFTDWSPYRYGTWRWIPPFGWTWVNDEPWGWATYHHGRWFYDAGYWYWSPYGYYRSTHSWWFPALVVINVFNDNVCWYPLSYRHHYHNYNAWYNQHHGGWHHNEPPPTPSATPLGPPIAKAPRLPNAAVTDDVPPGGVVTVGVNSFGTGVKSVRTAPLNVAKAVLAQSPDYSNAEVLPDHSAVSKRAGREIVAEQTRKDLITASANVGAAKRTSDAPLDNDLRTTRILGGRIPVPDAGITGGEKVDDSAAREPRKTGAIERPPIKTVQLPAIPPTTVDPPERPPVKERQRTDPPVRQEPPSYQPPRPESPPAKQPPARQDPPKSDPPAKAPPAKSEGTSGSDGAKKSKSDR